MTPKLKATLRRILNRMPHNEDENASLVGYKGKGKWDFLWTNLSVKPDELTVLFKAVGFDLERMIEAPTTAKPQKTQRSREHLERIGRCPNQHWIFVEPRHEHGWFVETNLAAFPEGECLPGGGTRILIPKGNVGEMAVTKLFAAIGRAFLAANGDGRGSKQPDPHAEKAALEKRIGRWPNRHWIYIEPESDGSWVVETSYLASAVSTGGKRLPDGRRQIRISGEDIGDVAVTKVFTALGRAFLDANFEGGA